MKRAAAIVLMLLGFPIFAQGGVVISVGTAQDVFQLMERGPGRAVFAAFAPNGKLVAVASSAGVKLYETSAFGSEDLLNPTGFFSSQSLAFSPDSAMLVALNEGYNVQIFDTGTGEVLRDMYPDNLGGSLGVAGYAPDGSTYAVTGSEYLNVYRSGTDEQLYQAPGHANRITAVVYSPDSSRIATSSWDGSVKVREAGTGTEILSLLGHSEGVLSVDYSPDGALLVTASADGTARLWDAFTGEELRVLAEAEGGFDSAAFSPDGNTVAVGGSGALLLVAPESGEVIAALSEGGSKILSVDFSPDGALLVAARAEQVQLWDITALAQIGAAGFHAAFTALAVNQDGSLLAAGTDDGTTYVYDTTTGDTLATYTVGIGPIRGLVFTLETPTLYIASDDTRIYEMELNTQEQVGFVDATAPIVDIAPHPTISMINAAMADGGLRWWSTETGEVFGTADAEAIGKTATATTFSPNGAWMASGGDAGQIFIWNVDTGDFAYMLDGAGGRVNDLAFSRDSQRVAAALADGRVLVWRLDNPGQPMLELTDFADMPTAVEFSADDSLVVAASRDWRVQYFDAQTGATVTTFYGHVGAALDVAFSPDGTRMYTAAEDGLVIFWGVP